MTKVFWMNQFFFPWGKCFNQYIRFKENIKSNARHINGCRLTLAMRFSDNHSDIRIAIQAVRAARTASEQNRARHIEPAFDPFQEDARCAFGLRVKLSSTHGILHAEHA